MKILKLTKKQYEVLRSAFILGAHCETDNLDNEGFDWDGNIINKKKAKEYEAYIKILRKLEIKLNCKIS
jgi:hypothetical protein